MILQRVAAFDRRITFCKVVPHLSLTGKKEAKFPEGRVAYFGRRRDRRLLYSEYEHRDVTDRTSITRCRLGRSVSECRDPLKIRRSYCTKCVFGT